MIERERTLIQKYATGIIRGLVEQVHAIGPLDHGPTKGRLRELFITQVLSRFLTSQFGIGSGVIINQRGDQSQQTDIIVYDNRILPPFIREESIGVFPVEAVLHTMEIKSRIGTQEVLDSDKSAKLIQSIANTGTIYGSNYRPMPITSSIVGFFKHGLADLEHKTKGQFWLRDNISCLTGICAVDTISWSKAAGEKWFSQIGNEYAEETKRFLGVMLDHLRTSAETNSKFLANHHHAWMSVYIRDNEFLRFAPQESPDDFE